MSLDSRDPLEPFVTHVCFQSGAALPLSITSDNMATWSKIFKKKKGVGEEPGEGEWRRVGVTEPLKGKKNGKGERVERD